MSINRYLKDKPMDHIDHALGRPFNPMVEGYRNHFAIDTAAPLADQFRASPHWKHTGTAPGGMAFFAVTDTGRAALRDHLKAIREPHKAFTVDLCGFEMTVIAKSRGKAFYDAFLRASDSMGLDFRDFCHLARIRKAE